MRCIAAALLVLLMACGGDDDPSSPVDAERKFLDNWPEIPGGPDFEGHETRVDEDERVLYICDCDAAERATRSGGPYGPSPRDPVTQESEAGYAHICPSGDE